MSEPVNEPVEPAEGGVRREFAAEVRQLLDMVIHSLYSEREVFLRELVSNASDALDRARILGLGRDDLLAADGEPGIEVSVDADACTVTITDNGVGLTREEAIEHLGTIAHSGTKAFVRALKEKQSAGEDANALIGQFGVGFYSALMVAERVVVHSRSAQPEAEPVVWSCDGSTTFQVGPGSRKARGTDVILHLREDANEFANADRLRDVVRKHSEFLRYPVRVDGELANQPQALWTRSPSELTDDDYKSFYRQVSGDWADPASWLHLRSEAPLQYRAVLYVPRFRPTDVDWVEGRRPVKLYARRVLIDQEARYLQPDWLRFMRGVVDSEDVQLNVSRELVQQTPVVEALKQQLTGRVLKHLKDWAAGRVNGPAEEGGEPRGPSYDEFWRVFGATLKEGVHADPHYRERLVELLRFNTSAHEDEKGLVSLEQYLQGMPEGQDAIWYLTAPDRRTAVRSPHLEAFRRKGWAVLLLTDAVDEWVVDTLREYQGKPLKSVARGEIDLEEPEQTLSLGLTGWMEGLLKGQVKQVRVSGRLTDSASVLVDVDGAMGANLERILRQLNQEVPSASRVLEINPRHPLVRTVSQLHAAGRTDEGEPLARLLLDQAQLLEGRVSDPEGLVQRLQALSGLAAQALGVVATQEAAEEPSGE